MGEIEIFGKRLRSLRENLGMTPVSYTHLDVYKRQELIHVYDDPQIAAFCLQCAGQTGFSGTVYASDDGI